MTIMLNLPSDGDNLNTKAQEAFLVELYRRDKLTHRELSSALGITRLETEGVLKRHGVTEDFPSEQEIQTALAHLTKMTPQ